MEELGGECTSHPLLLTVYRLTGVPNTGGSAIVYRWLYWLFPVIMPNLDPESPYKISRVEASQTLE
eukprot:SAG11_NODE_2520_length_3263_cov_2.014223_4_plen_66_part_00